MLQNHVVKFVNDLTAQILRDERQKGEWEQYIKNKILKRQVFFGGGGESK